MVSTSFENGHRRAAPYSFSMQCRDGLEKCMYVSYVAAAAAGLGVHLSPISSILALSINSPVLFSLWPKF